MNSEFQHVALDELRYSLVWEGHATLYRALDIQPTDHVLVIAGAGCNVLNTLLQGPSQVTAIDLNPEQNRLLRLKCHVIQQHEYDVFRGLLGLAGPAAVAAAWAAVRPGLPVGEQEFWAAFFARHPGGLLGAGRLETYVNAFLGTLAPVLQEQLRQLLHCASVAGQQAYFQAVVDAPDSAFRQQFIAYFDAANLSKGRDPRLFRYAQQSGGALFYQRLQQHLGRELLRDNFFSRFFFFGPAELPDTVLPPCYQRRHYATLRARLPRLQQVTGEATAYLLSAAGQSVTKASLSNIFEYVSGAEFEQVCQQLSQQLSQQQRQLRLVFWNLLQVQAPTPTDAVPLLAGLSQELSAQEACFYFDSVRVLHWNEAERPHQEQNFKV
jgi:S-adenosylmethionine-diacylglycerol 3-amino-3-carboxypropyl transferase